MTADNTSTIGMVIPSAILVWLLDFFLVTCGPLFATMIVFGSEVDIFAFGVVVATSVPVLSLVCSVLAVSRAAAVCVDSSFDAVVGSVVFTAAAGEVESSGPGLVFPSVDTTVVLCVTASGFDTVVSVF